MILERYTDLNPNVDSFLVRLNENIIASETVLKEQDKMRLFAGLIGGNYIEKQYILFNIIFKSNVDLPDTSRLITMREILYAARKHMNKLPEVIALIESIKEETDPGTILNELKAIEAIRQQNILPEDISQITPSQVFETLTF